MDSAIWIEKNAGTVFLQDPIFRCARIDGHLVLKARASAGDYFDTQPIFLTCPTEKLPDLFCGAIGDCDVSNLMD